jgi:hypothetical protein
MRKRRDSADRTKRIMVLILAVLIGFSGGSGTSRYNGFKVASGGDFWTIKIDKKPVFFTYHPADAEAIAVEKSAIDLLHLKPQIDVTSDANSTLADSIALAEYQMATTMQNFGTYVRPGFTSDAGYDAPRINCSIATPFVPVIYFRESNQTTITVRDSCIIAEAQYAQDVIRIKDRLLYGIFGVIP